MAFELNLEGVWSVEGEWEEVFRGSECYVGTVLLEDDRGPRGHWTLQNLEKGESSGWKH